MTISAHIDIPGGYLKMRGEQPFLVVGADHRKPLEGPWIVVDATGDNAVRHPDDIRAFFPKHADARAVAEQLNRLKAA